MPAAAVLGPPALGCAALPAAFVPLAAAAPAVFALVLLPAAGALALLTVAAPPLGAALDPAAAAAAGDPAAALGLPEIPAGPTSDSAWLR